MCHGAPIVQADGRDIVVLVVLYSLLVKLDQTLHHARSSIWQSIKGRVELECDGSSQMVSHTVGIPDRNTDVDSLHIRASSRGLRPPLPSDVILPDALGGYSGGCSGCKTEGPPNMQMLDSLQKRDSIV